MGFITGMYCSVLCVQGILNVGEVHCMGCIVHLCVCTGCVYVCGVLCSELCFCKGCICEVYSSALCFCKKCVCEVTVVHCVLAQGVF